MNAACAGNGSAEPAPHPLATGSAGLNPLALVSDAGERGEMASHDIDLARLDAWWRAANYLILGQIYLL